MQKSEVRHVVFEVEQSWRLPDLTPIVPVGGEVRDVSDQGNSTYYDTKTGRLRGLGLTLERRRNDDGTSWLLELPDGGAQAGLQSRAQGSKVPAAVARQLAGVLAGEDLVEVASLSTSWETHRVMSEDGQLVVEVTDGRLQGATLGETSTMSEWRELEIRPGSDAHQDVLRQLRQSVKRSGGTRRDQDASALDRLLGRLAPQAPNPKLARRVSEYTGAQCAEILLSDIALRNHNDVSSVHRMRVAIRRLRSVVKGFSPLMRPETASVADDLRWVALQLGAVRDLDVLDARITSAVHALPEADLVGPVARQLGETLAIRRARLQVMAARMD